MGRWFSQFDRERYEVLKGLANVAGCGLHGTIGHINQL
jgi:hypothetical protein